MKDKFDELTKGLAQSVTRRQALSHFGRTFAGMLLASLGLATSAYAGKGRQSKKFGRCQVDWTTGFFTGVCVFETAGGDPGNCPAGYSQDCVGYPQLVTSDARYCYTSYDSNSRCRLR